MISLAVFWLAAGLLVYTYVLFPLLILGRGLLRPRPVRKADYLPKLSVIVAAHNEERHIGARLDNLLEQGYPDGAMEIVVGSDGSDDGTEDIVRGYAERGVVLVAGPRRGKGPTINAAVARSSGDVLVFTDANTHFQPGALRSLLRPFADPRVGGVAGNQVYVRTDRQDLAADGEMMYWSFDRWMKEAESRADSVTSATGAIYAIRREHYQPVPDFAVDDFIISTGVVARGARLVFEADAVALEPVVARAQAEFSRKIRLITQGLYSLRVMRRLMNPARYGFYALQLTWHKLLRRFMVFPLLALVLVSPWLWRHGPLFELFVIGELLFLAAAAAGLLLQRASRPGGVLVSFPFYFCMVNLAALIAFVNHLLGRQVKLWNPERKLASGERKR